MQTSEWKSPPANEPRPRCAPDKRRLVSQALREAYRLHSRDSFTRVAVRQALGN